MYRVYEYINHTVPYMVYFILLNIALYCTTVYLYCNYTYVFFNIFTRMWRCVRARKNIFFWEIFFRSDILGAGTSIRSRSG